MLRWPARRFDRDTSSTVVIEFAIIVPVMLIFFLATIELTLFLRLQQKLDLAAGQLAELIAAQPSVTEGSAEGPGGTLGDMCTGVSYDLLPFNPSQLAGYMESTTVTQPFGLQKSQDWANDKSCPTAYPEGSFYETITLTNIASTPYSMFTQNGIPESAGGTLVKGYSAISVELVYVYKNIIPFYLGSSLTLTAVGVARPRSNTTIPCTYPSGATTATCPGIY